MPEPIRWTEIDNPVIALFAAALGAPGQTRKEYDAKLCELSSGPAPAGLPVGLPPEGDGEADAPELERPVGPAEDDAPAGLDPESAPGSAPAWRADQPCTPSRHPATAVTVSSAAPRGPRDPPEALMPHYLVGACRTTFFHGSQATWPLPEQPLAKAHRNRSEEPAGMPPSAGFGPSRRAALDTVVPWTTECWRTS